MIYIQLPLKRLKSKTGYNLKLILCNIAAKFKTNFKLKSSLNNKLYDYNQ
ncbi:hypothetical protein Dtox_3430 [Desulfofarcimen acetoxidans DSM 771]|uniref:Uncharacterized protein n=1 Tax=Desulfofarcimen acetoxidans (strain ATCC 49208 / DSM 771 / KCTC 5769 / VKM B-1644 / 5575) TaxID=485916 RepID=C8W6P4_DESAS|nr:hypothetical protein Dtox_3430 [Desulfofarcimen acetoxidans DSM 771]